jgi:hypothetical protein
MSAASDHALQLSLDWLAPFLPHSNPTTSKIPSQPLYSRLWARNERSATLTRKWLIIEALTILTTKTMAI